MKTPSVKLIISLVQWPWFYAILYFSLIPTFAFLYSMEYQGFYHSTVKYEAPLIKYKRNIADELRESIITTYKNQNNVDYIVHNTTSFNINDISISNLQVEETNLRVDQNVKISFSLSFRYFTLLIDGRPDLIMKPDESLQIAFKYHLGSIKSSAVFGVRRTKLEIKLPHNYQFLPKVEDFIYPIWEAKDFDFDYFSSCHISEKMHRNLIAYTYAINGMPIKDNFVRMLYLSAVTITTLGYGDIVPLSTKARFLVAFESVLGLVFIGLFLGFLNKSKKSTHTNRLNMDG